MTSNELKLSEDWGWFVDIEYEFEKQQHRSNIKITKKINILKTIEEDDEYEYYKNIYRNIDIETGIEYKNKNNFINKKEDNMVYDVASTTFFTTILGYIAYFVL